VAEVAEETRCFSSSVRQSPAFTVWELSKATTAASSELPIKSAARKAATIWAASSALAVCAGPEEVEEGWDICKSEQRANVAILGNFHQVANWAVEDITSTGNFSRSCFGRVSTCE
jgi:hypothetical protein